jgi:hypothetical protein
MAKNKYKTCKNQPKEKITALKNRPKEKRTEFENHESNAFNWKIDNEYYKRQKELRFFCEYTLSVLRILEASKLTWEEIHKRPNTHPFKVSEVSWRYQEILVPFCDRREIDYGAFYQIPGQASGAHPMMGYRKEGVFYLVMDDKDHGMFPQ